METYVKFVVDEQLLDLLIYFANVRSKRSLIYYENKNELTPRQAKNMAKWNNLFFDKDLIGKRVGESGKYEVVLPKRIALYLFESYNNEAKNTKVLSPSFIPIYLDSFKPEEWEAPATPNVKYGERPPPRRIATPSRTLKNTTDKEGYLFIPVIPIETYQPSSCSSPSAIIYTPNSVTLTPEQVSSSSSEPITLSISPIVKGAL